MEKEKNRNITNPDNYKKVFKNTDNMVFEYVKIMHEYLSHIMTYMKIKDKKHYMFILKRGYDLLKNIFLTLIYYTNNLELVSFHLRKSYLYYTEFIGQIGEDSNSYLQLNSKDACLFVYKKTVYDINEEFKKMHEIDPQKKEEIKIFKKKIMLIDEIEKMFIELKIQHEELDNLNWINKLRITMVKIMEEINKITKKEYNRDIFKKINVFLDFLKYKEYDYNKRSAFIYNFIKKIVKKDINKEILIKLPIYDNEELTPVKFVNKLFRK
jgi:hypothetical protein